MSYVCKHKLSLLALIGLASSCTQTRSVVDLGHDASRDLPPVRDIGRDKWQWSDSRRADIPAPIDTGAGALCPGGRDLFGSAFSGVYQGTATVVGGKFNKAGTHPAILALASICGAVRGVLLVRQSDEPATELISYKAKGTLTSTGTLDKLVLSDRYCGAVECMPHIVAGVGLEIFSADIVATSSTLSSNQIIALPAATYPDLEFPFTSLVLNRIFPTSAQQPSPAVGRWNAKLILTSEMFAEPPMSGDNELLLTSGKSRVWHVGPYQNENALDDKQIFPYSSFEPHDPTHLVAR